MPEAAKQRLAIVDDNEESRHLLCAYLESRFAVTAHSSVHGVILHLEEHECDLIISDISMPERDGFDLMAELQSDPRRRHLPVIAITAHGDFFSRRARAAGFRAYLTKPVDLDDLLEVVESCLKAAIDT
jgi:CheY-like chemotaxis protein